MALAPKLVSKLIELNNTATVQVSKYQGTVYIAIRYMYESPTGELLFGKNGVNIPIEWFPKALLELVNVYNEATGSELTISGEALTPDPEAVWPEEE